MSSPIAARMAVFAKAPIEGFEKEAWNPLPTAKAVGGWIGRRLGMGGKAAPSGGVGGPFVGPGPLPAPRIGTAPPGGMNIGRKLALGGGAAAGTAGLGTVGYGHLQDDAANTPGRTVNPLTWFGDRPSREDIFQRNNNTFNSMSADLNSQMEAARASGDLNKFEELQRQLDSGDFGGGGRGGDWWNPLSWNSPAKWRLGGLNPFAQQNANYYQRNALNQQSAMQGEYAGEMAKSGPQPGDQQKLEAIKQRMASGSLLPAQATALQKQLQMLESRMRTVPGTENDAAKAIRERMLGAGMRLAEGPKPEPAPMSGGNYYSYGRQPPKPQGRTGVSQHQYQRDPFITPYDETMQSYGNIRGQG